MMQQAKLAFIGAGNITRSLVAGLIANGFSPKNIWAANPGSEKLTYFRETFGIYTTEDNLLAAKQADVIIFSVKPIHLAEVCAELKEIIVKDKPLVISIVTGVTTKMLEKWLGGKLALVRAMPNIASSVGAGATGLFANDEVDDEQKDLAEQIFRAVGLALWIGDESHIDTVVAISGSGPAYFFLVMEAMQQFGIAMGLSSDVARLLVSQTALGASRMAMEALQDVSQLRQAVTSPNGTTERAIAVLEEGNIRALFAKALAAASERSKELTRQLDTK